MGGHIPRSFINDILAKAEISSVVGSRVKLKKAGANWHACCPFHHEKTPSFTVSDDKQFYHCFGCGAHGNAINFLMEYDNLEFPEAVEELANFLGLEVPREEFKNRNGDKPSLSYKTKKDLFEVMGDIAQFYQQQLPKNIPAQSYVQQRGLSTEIIQRFGIGFAPNSYHEIKQKFAKSAEELKRLSDLGMVSRNDRGETYDRFRNRLMFPIRDKRGRTIAFGGRVLDDSRPKYLNSPESVTYHKGNELYGLYEVLQSNDSPNCLLIVEGYMDVVALAQFGVNYAVASLGTATTPEQLTQAFRVTEQVICCYDGDRAGREAAWRALENALPLLEDGRQLKFIFLPDGEDPDTYIRQYGQSGFEEYLQSAVSFSAFFFQHLVEQVDLSSKEGKSKLAALAAPLISRIAGGMLKQYMKNMLGQKLGILDPLQIENLFPKEQINPQKPQSSQPQIKRTPLRLLIGLLLQNPQLATLEYDLEPIKSLKEPGFELFYLLTECCRKHPGIKMGQLLELFRQSEHYKALEMLSTWSHLVAPDTIENTFVDTLAYLFKRFVEQQMEQLIAKQRSLGLSADEKQLLNALLTQNYN